MAVSFTGYPVPSSLAPVQRLRVSLPLQTSLVVSLPTIQTLAVTLGGSR